MNKKEVAEIKRRLRRDRALGPSQPGSEAPLRPFSVGGCSGYWYAVVAGNDAMLPQRGKKVKRFAE